MKNIISQTLLLCCLILLSGAVTAQWSTDPAVNNNICNLDGEQVIPKIATCPNGDTYIGFFSSEGGNYNVRLQRLDVQGNILWAQNGILISDNTQETWLTDWDMTCDAANHAILAFNDIRSGNTNVVAYRISPSGNFVWGADGIMLSNSTAFNAAPKVVVTAAGNAVFAWSADDVIIMQKVSPSGTLMWGSNGITLSSSNRLTWPQLMPVGSDEVILKYFEDSGPVYSPTRHVFAQKYSATGTAVWSSPASISQAGGITAWTQIFPFVNDGSDGFYIAWHDDRDNNQLASIFVQHVNASGVVQFVADGIEATTASSMNHFYAKLALPPGSTDIFVYWNEMNSLQTQWGIYGQKISSSGALQWTSTGKVFIPVSSTDVYPYEARKSPTDMVLFYEEYANAVEGIIKVMRIATDGSYVWTPAQKTLCSVVSQKVHPVVNEFASNQWIASWEDDRNDNVDIYAQNIQLNGDLGPVNITYGTIAGTITLNGGTGDVTQVLVQAGTYTTNPDATGYYSMDVLTGTYTVEASLAGYYPASQSNVVVTTNQTTTVNLTLNHIPAGFIEGDVTLVGGSGSVNMVLVSAGSATTNPDANGHYVLEAAPGTYNVIATLAAYYPDTVFGVVVTDGQTTGGVDFTLNVAPTNGFVTGTVTLDGGSGDVTQAVVNAGGYTTNPDATGFYTLDLPAGYYDISASLSGYITQMIVSVQVIAGQTTPDVNFTLIPEENAGTIEGTVTLTGGTADVALAEVTAGGYSTHPDATGFYSLSVPAGTYDVVATHPYTTNQTIEDVIVNPNQTTSGIDFLLTVNRADLVCTAIDQDGTLMNDVDVNIDGPEGPYTGTILNDSLVFLHVPYGTYYGTATYNSGAPVLSDTVVGEENHHLVFNFDITGINEINSNGGLQVNPNPVGPHSTILLTLKEAGEYSYILADVGGKFISAGKLQGMEAGQHSLRLMDITGEQILTPGMYYLRFTNEKGWQQGCTILSLGQ